MNMHAIEQQRGAGCVAATPLGRMMSQVVGTSARSFSPSQSSRYLQGHPPTTTTTATRAGCWPQRQVGARQGKGQGALRVPATGVAHPTVRPTGSQRLHHTVLSALALQRRGGEQMATGDDDVRGAERGRRGGEVGLTGVFVRGWREAKLCPAGWRFRTEETGQGGGAAALTSPSASARIVSHAASSLSPNLATAGRRNTCY